MKSVAVKIDSSMKKNIGFLFLCIIILIATTNSLALIRTEQINLLQGWNLISIPLYTEDNSVESVLKSISGQYVSVWSYDSNGWKRYIIGRTDNNLFNMEPGKGYWIYINNAPAVLVITGDDNYNKPVNLKKGWNLVGYNSLQSLSIDNALCSIKDNCFSVWTYTSEKWEKYIPGSSDNKIENMSSWKGYWIYAKDDCVWDIMDDYYFLLDISKKVWNYLKWARTNHLPWSWKSEIMDGGDYANPSEIGFSMLCYLCAYELKKPWSPLWTEVRSEIYATLNQLQRWQNGTQQYQPHGPNSFDNKLFYQWYWIGWNWNPPVVGKNNEDQKVPSIDNAWLAVSLIIIKEYMKQIGDHEIVSIAEDILSKIDFTLWYDYNTHLFKWGGFQNPNDGTYCDYYSNENRIINFVARALGQISKEEFQNSLKALIQEPGVYDGITVDKVNWDGSYFTYTSVALFIKEMDRAYGKDTIDQATNAQIEYAKSKGYSVWGISDCFGVANNGYVQRGAPPRGSNDPNTDIDDGLITPHASAMALITKYKDEAIHNLRKLKEIYPDLYNNNYGFYDSVNVITNENCYRFSTLTQQWIFLSIANYLTNFLWNYFYMDEGVVQADHEMFSD